MNNIEVKMKSSLFDLVLFVVLASVTSGFAKNTGETFSSSLVITSISFFNFFTCVE